MNVMHCFTLDVNCLSSSVQVQSKFNLSERQCDVVQWQFIQKTLTYGVNNKMGLFQ